MLEIKQLSFAYPGQEDMLRDINLTIKQGEFVVLCGVSGSGKTTLLRQMKPEIRPFGQRTGTITVGGKDVEEMDAKESAITIGYVSQNAENQIVTDKVWHELAFGLENLGVEEGKIRNRVAEMASFFGMNGWFHQSVNELSGGQKQKLCLASVLVMQPDYILLDEPVSKLDPISAYEFLQLLSRIHRELNTTIILTEHNLRDVFYFADRILCMDAGRIISDGSPYEVINRMAERSIFPSLPIEIQVAYHQGFHQKLAAGEHFKEVFRQRYRPVEVKKEKEQSISRFSFWKRNRIHEEPVLTLKNIYYSYDGKREVLKDVSLKITAGESVAVLGANGCGKSTLLGIMAGLIEKYQGKRDCSKKVTLLTQDVQTLFVKKTVKEDLALLSSPREAEMIEAFGLEPFLEKHPYDLSGGEQQLVAIAKIFMTDADIYLLDEPTKGIDCVLKEKAAEMIQKERERGKTFVIVSHDIEFCARNTNQVLMLFDGETMGRGETRTVLLSNAFYTTALKRLLGKDYPDVLLEEDVERYCIRNS